MEYAASAADIMCPSWNLRVESTRNVQRRPSSVLHSVKSFGCTRNVPSTVVSVS
jgi:hypothetical protein